MFALHLELELIQIRTRIRHQTRLPALGVLSTRRLGVLLGCYELPLGRVHGIFDLGLHSIEVDVNKVPMELLMGPLLDVFRRL